MLYLVYVIMATLMPCIDNLGVLNLSWARIYQYQANLYKLFTFLLHMYVLVLTDCCLTLFEFSDFGLPTK